jgi:hypothetical protein
MYDLRRFSGIHDLSYEYLYFDSKGLAILGVPKLICWRPKPYIARISSRLRQYQRYKGLKSPFFFGESSSMIESFDEVTIFHYDMNFSQRE